MQRIICDRAQYPPLDCPDSEFPGNISEEFYPGDETRSGECLICLKDGELLLDPDGCSECVPEKDKFKRKNVCNCM